MVTVGVRAASLVRDKPSAFTAPTVGLFWELQAQRYEVTSLCFSYNGQRMAMTSYASARFIFD